MPARERPGKRQSRSSAGFLNFVVALFRIFGKATSFRRSENSPSGPVEVALFKIKGKGSYRWLRLERSPPSDGLTKRRSALARQLPALALLACRIGLQRGESGTKAECIRVGIWDALQQGLHLAALVDAVVQNASNVSRATA